MRKIYILLACLCMIVSLNSCKNEDEKKLSDFYTNAEYINVDYTHEILSFELLILTKNEIKDIQVAKINDGEMPLQDFEIKIWDNSIDEIKNFTYRNLHPSVWIFEFDHKKDIDKVEIDKIALLVDGKEQEVKFGKTLVLSNGGGTKFSGDLQPGVVPMEFPSSMINGDLTPIYSFTSLKDLSIEKMYSHNDIDISIKDILINGEKVGDTSYPIELREGDEVEISVGFSSEKLSANSYMIANLFIEYLTEGNTDHFKSIITASPIYPIMDGDLEPLKKYIDKIINK